MSAVRDLRSALIAALGLACAAVGLVGCGGGTDPVMVSWRLADGRGCSDAGVTLVQLAADELDHMLDRVRCTDGQSPSQITVQQPFDTLLISAESAQGAPLYVGRIARGSLLQPGTVVLYAVGIR
jgi:hypothetical protein